MGRRRETQPSFFFPTCCSSYLSSLSCFSESLSFQHISRDCCPIRLLSSPLFISSDQVPPRLSGSHARSFTCPSRPQSSLRTSFILSVKQTTPLPPLDCHLRFEMLPHGRERMQTCLCSPAAVYSWDLVCTQTLLILLT